MGRAYQPNTESYMAGTSAVAYDFASNKSEDHGQEALKVQVEKTKYSINPLYTLVLMSLVFLMLAICVMMLKAQFTVASTSDQVMQKKHELTELRRENAHLESMINQKLDLVEIKRIAMEEYGMVFPTDQDVITIASEEGSYTVQYMTVEPLEVEKTTIGNVLAFITRGW